MKVGIFHTAFVGDVALLGLLIEGLAKAGHQVSLFSNSPGLQLYQEDPRVQERIIIKKGTGLDKARLLMSQAKSIADAKVDCLLVPHRSTTTALITKLSRVKKTIGYSDAALPWTYHERMTRRLDCHESVRCLDLAPDWLISASIKQPLRELSRPILSSRPNPKAFLARFPNAWGQGQTYIVVAPGSVWATKIYPPERLALVISRLMEKDSNLACVVSGSEKDRGPINDFLVAMAKSIAGTRIFNTIGCLPLAELVTIIADAKMVISNDSAPLHIASGTNTPVLGIYGPTPWDTGFGPASDKSSVVAYANEHGAPLECQPCGTHGHKECPLKHHRCMKELSANIVEAAALSIYK